MKYKLDKALIVGDFRTSVSIDELEIQSVSFTLDPQMPVLSVVLLHAASGWQHNVVYKDSSAVEFWARTLEPEFDKILKTFFKKLVADKQLPPGVLVEENT